MIRSVTNQTPQGPIINQGIRSITNQGVSPAISIANTYRRSPHG